MKKVTVTVPASTSNLGPGFDALGLALDWRNEVVFEQHPGPTEELQVSVEGEGAGSLPQGEDNLIARAASSILAGRRMGRLVIRCTNAVPLARGLGSSAAAAVAGVAGANALIGSPLSARDIFQYAAVLEGHPDNAASAALGGLTVSIKEGRDWKPHALKVHPDLRVIVCVPEFELKTSEARAALPNEVLREAAVENISRAALLVSALEHGDWNKLAAAVEDRLHQPYRAALIPGFGTVLRAAMSAKARGAFLSGAGPSIAAFAAASDPTEAIGAAMVEAFAKHEVKSHARVLSVSTEGVKAL